MINQLEKNKNREKYLRTDTEITRSLFLKHKS